jgi:hypothetical protein
MFLREQDRFKIDSIVKSFLIHVISKQIIIQENFPYDTKINKEKKVYK